MGADARPWSKVPWPCHLGDVTGAPHEAPKLPRRSVTQDSVASRSQHSRHPRALDAMRDMADAVDPAMDREKPATDSLVDRPNADPILEQLPTSNYAVLTRRKLRDPLICHTRVAFAPYSWVNATLAFLRSGHVADDART